MPKNINQELAHIFEEMGILYEIKEDKFRQRAYHRGAATMENLAENAEEVYKKGGVSALVKLPGIGQGMAQKIEEYIKTGHVKEHEELKKEIPVELEELTQVEGVGPKTVQQLYKELGITNLKELKKAAEDKKIRELEGLGAKTEENILEGISFVEQNSGRVRLGDALPYALELIEEIRNLEGVQRVSEAGSLRRRQETIGDVDILVSAPSAGSGQVDNAKKVFDHVENLPQVVKTWGRGETKLSVHLRHGIDIDVRAVAKESYGAALQYFTGSKEHNVKLRQIAIDKGYKLNEYGLFSAKGGSASGGKENNLVKGKSEEEIYKKLGFKQVPPPETRTDSGEVEAAQKGVLPEVVQYGSLKGDLQIQTKWTDGAASIESMAKTAKDFGLEYIAITDHTKNLAMTGGLNDKKVLEQKKEIEKINKKLEGITVLAGTECDILKDGSLDLEDKTLAQLDFVGVSVHSHFNLSRKDQTARVVKAMQNPNVHCFFHPTARRLQKRPAIDLDMEEVINTAKKTGTILEINAHPERLDLKDEHIRMAVGAKVKMAINSDAHSTDGFGVLHYGLAQARRGWATKNDIVNTLPLDKFLKELKNNK